VLETVERQPVYNRRMLFMVGAVLLAAFVAFLNSLNFYQIEDDSALARSAYQANLVLNLSFSMIYITAIVIAVAAISLCVQFMLSLWNDEAVSGIYLFAACLAIFVALGAFWGLALRHPLSFFLSIGLFAALIVVVLALGRNVAIKFSPPFVEQRVTAISSFSISLVLALLVNVLVAVLHTLLLKVAVPTLYADNNVRIAAFPVNSLLLMTLFAALLTFVAALLVARYSFKAAR
jgi:hypothetical protein